MNKDNEKKKKVVYEEDDGRTIYSMSALDGLTPEEQEERDKQRKNRVNATWKERRAMIAAAFEVYAPMLLVIIGSFSFVALMMYFFLK